MKERPPLLASVLAPTMALVVAFILAWVPGKAGADQLIVSEQQIVALGVETSAPTAANTWPLGRATGRVMLPPGDEFVVTTMLNGLVSELAAGVGDQVSAGEILAVIDSPAFLSLQRDYLEARNNHHLARTQLGRDQQLSDEGIIARRRLQESVNRANNAAAIRREHHDVLRLAGMTDAEIDELSRSQELVGALGLRAPRAGVVVERYGEVGERVEALSAIYRLADHREPWLEIDIPGTLAQDVTPGMRVVVDDPMMDVMVEAQITVLSSAIDPATQTVRVRAEFIQAPSDSAIRPGQFIVVSLMQRTDRPIWLLDESGLIRSAGRQVVFIRTAGGFRAQEVEVLGSRHGKVALAGELSTHDRIATRGIIALKALWMDRDGDSD